MKSFLISLAAIAVTQPSWAAPNVAQYLVQQGWTAYDSKARLTMPADDIVPVIYYINGASVPSCGLLSGAASAPKFIEILSPEAGEQYPHCPSINDAAGFKMAGRDYVVVEYSNRDSRNDTFEEFFYVYKNRVGQYEADEQLNADASSVGDKAQKTRPKAADGIRLARAYALKQSQPGMELQTRDLLIDGGNAFAVFKDQAHATCSFVLDNGAAVNKYSSELFAEPGKCVNYLASSKLDTPTKTYYLGMFKGSDAATNIAIVSVNKANAAVQAEKDLARAAAATGKVSDIKNRSRPT
jgi:hypothetical protein